MRAMDRFVPSRRVMLVVAWVAVVVAAVVGYLGVSAALARSHLQQAKTALHAVKADLVNGDEAAARRDLARADHDADAAHRNTGGPVWALAAHLPWIGRPLDTVRGIATEASDLTSHTLPRVVDVAATLSPQRLRI